MIERAFLILGLALTPIYSFASGGIQPSHVALAMFMLLRLTGARSEWNSALTMLTLVLVLIMGREGYGVLFDSAPPTAFLDVIYLLFAVLTVTTFSRIPLNSPDFNSAVKIGLLMSAAIALAGIWYYGVSFKVEEGQYSRAVGTFNNPNQLAYFAICLSSIGSLFYARNQIGMKSYLFLMITAVICSLSALSKAGLLAIGFSTVLGVAWVVNKKRLSPILILSCALIVGLAILLYQQGVFDGFSFIRRLDAIGADSDDNLATRGYLLPPITETMKLMFGVGQAGVQRMLGHEVHSTFWSFMLKYGLVGFTLFVTFWTLWIKHVWKELGIVGVLLVVAPATLYGTTHNGSRFAIFWILVGFSFNLGKAEIRVRKAQARGPRPLPMALGPVQTLQPTAQWQSGHNE